MKQTIFFLILISAAFCPLNSQETAAENLASVRRAVDFNVIDSVDNYGNLYIRFHSFHPSVLTYVNNDGAVTVCASDNSAGVTHIYEYSADLEEQETIALQNELGSLGAFTKDSGGNYYFFYAANAANRNSENMAVVKYNGNGDKINTFRLIANAPNSFGGIRIPFDAGTCRMEISGSMLAVYFAREKFNGHQASYGFILDKNTFTRIDTGAATNSRQLGGISEIPYSSHSFNQFILPVENGFIFADHGDAYPRSFTFAEFIRGSATRRLHAFTFPGTRGANATYAEMGGLARTSTGYIFCGTYGRISDNARNLFILTFGDDMARCSAPVYLTNYSINESHAGHPKIVSLNDGRYFLLWEKFNYSTQAANVLAGGRTGYLSTYAMLIDESGQALCEPYELPGIRLNINDTLRYNSHNGKVYWAVNDRNSIIVYALQP